MTSPTNGEPFISPGTIVLQATATSSGSIISNVTYMDGPSKIATVSAGPSYTYNWKTATAGPHSLAAIAKDKTGATTTSATVAITVTNDVAPVVTLTSPANGFSTLGPATISLAATAYSSDSAVTSVAFYEDGVKKATTKVSPYQFALKGVAVGTHTFYAVATDALGVTGQSATATVNITADVPPTVTITSPANGTTSILGAPIVLNATASSTDEPLATVTYEYGSPPATTVIAKTKAPFNYTWKKAALGNYSITAVATDALGVTGTSIPVSVTVVPDQAPSVSLVSPLPGANYVAPASVELVATASSSDTSITNVVFYSAAGKIATVTKAPYVYDWKPSGSGSFSVYAIVTDSVGTTTQSSTVTFSVTSATTSTVKITAPTSGKVLAAPANVTLTATATVPTGDSVSSVTYYASGAPIGTSTSPTTFPYSWQNIPAGVYYLTAVATDAKGASVTSAPITLTSDAPPVVTVSTPGNQAIFAAPAVINLMANVTDLGKITKVVFMCGSTVIGTATSAPYQVSWTNVGAGPYSVTATAYDSLNITGTSAPLSLTVVNDAGPVVTLETPANALVFGASNVVSLAYSVTDSAAPITKVEIYRNGPLVATLTSPTSGSTWTFTEQSPLPVGSYTYYARAYDSDGTSTDSTVATILVAPAVPYVTDFEPDEGPTYYNLGLLAGQGGWANPQGTANISSVAYSGVQSLQLAAGSPVAVAQQAFAPTAGETIVYCDFYAEPVAETIITSSSLFTAEQAQFGFVQSNGQAVLEVFQGNGSGGGAWAPTTFTVPIGTNNQVQSWVRLTARLDFTRQKWDMYANATLVAYDIPFISNSSTFFSAFQAQGDANTDTFVDLLSIVTTDPLFPDTANDGISDTWKEEYGLSITTNDRYLNLSGDGIPILQDFLTGANPLINTKVVPDPIQSGLVLQLRADAGVVADSNGNVSEWLDQSPNANIATQCQPTLLPVLTPNQAGGFPALAFNSTNGAPLLSLPFNMMGNAGAGEIIAVVKIGSNPNIFNTLWWLGSGYGSSYINSVHYEDFGTSDLSAVTENPTEVAQYFIYDTSISSAGTSVFRYNGDARWTRTNLPVQFNQNPSLGGLVGDIAEVIVYNRVLTDAERTTLGTYLQGKYELPTIVTPATPSDLTATALSSDTVDLFWTAQNSLMHTVTTIQRQSGGGAFVQVAQVSDAASYTDTGLTSGVTYTYQISVQSYVGTSGTSNSATVTTPESLADIPTQGMALWLRSTAGTLGAGGLSTWVDQSGLGNNAVSFDQVSLPNVVASQVNGLPVVRFSGANALTLPPNMLQAAQAGQIIGVVRVNSPSSGSTNILWSFGTGYQTTYYDALLLDDFGSNDTSSFQETEAQISQYYVFDSSIDATGNAIHRYDGTSEWVRPPNPNVQYGFGAYPAIGGYPPGALNGDIAEVIVYSRVLSEGEQNSVYAYLASKYSLPGIVANLNSPVVTSSWLTQYFGSFNVNTSLDYNGNGQTVAQDYASGSNPVDITNGRPFAITFSSAATLYTYDQSGRLNGVSHANGVNLTVTSDNASNITGVSNFGPIVQWRISNNLPADGTGNGSDTAVLANDGVPNLVKYALGLNPTTAVTGAVPVVVLSNSNGNGYLTLTYTRPDPAPTDILYQVQVSSDGIHWSSGTGAIVNVSTTVTSGLASVVVSDATPVGTQTFGRQIRLAIQRLP